MTELYYLGFSAPCRAVAITANILGIDICKINVDLMQEDQLQKNILALNRELTVPVLVDDGEVFHESRSIMRHLVRKYGRENHQLYPNDINKQYKIDRYLDFDIGTFFGRFKYMVTPLMESGKPIQEEAKEQFLEALRFLDSYLKGKQFITGDGYTLADISLATLASQVYMTRINMSCYSNVNAWLERCNKSIPHFKEENENGIAFKSIVDAKFQALES